VSAKSHVVFFLAPSQTIFVRSSDSLWNWKKNNQTRLPLYKKARSTEHPRPQCFRVQAQQLRTSRERSPLKNKAKQKVFKNNMSAQQVSFMRSFRLLSVSVLSAAPLVVSSAELRQKQTSPESFLRQLQGSNVDFSCNVQADTTCGSKFDNTCDNNEPDCQDGDCWDCSLCRQFDYDCNSCLEQNGCIWCPGDAICLNSQWFSGGECSRGDYPEDSCTTIGDTNIFEYVHHAMQKQTIRSDKSKERVSRSHFLVVPFLIEFIIFQ
jgi:hypothetical protein